MHIQRQPGKFGTQTDIMLFLNGNYIKIEALKNQHRARWKLKALNTLLDREKRHNSVIMHL